MSVTMVLDILTNSMKTLMTDDEIGEQVNQLFVMSLKTIHKMYEGAEREIDQIVSEVCRKSGIEYDPETMIVEIKNNSIKIKED